MSLEVLALSENSWQLTTLKPYPSQAYPLISMVSTWTSSCPVFSTLNVLFNVKFGSLSFKPERKENQTDEKITSGVNEVYVVSFCMLNIMSQPHMPKRSAFLRFYLETLHFDLFYS